jgi:hypothetical protein
MRTSLLTLVFATSIASSAQDVFPDLTGETANGTVVTLPKANGRPWTIVGLAYSQKAAPALEEWYEPAYLRFIAKHGLFAGAYEADVYFVPLFVGVNKAAYEPSLKKFRKSAEPEIVDHVLFSKADIGPLQEALGLTEKDRPYFFILDPDGRIVHRSEGAFTDDKLDAMEEVLLE